MAAELRVCVDTVGKWRSRFLEQRLDGLLDQPRSGRPRMIDDADVERVIALTLEATPKDATHWSTRSMARRSGLSHNTVSRIWRAFALQPHRTETFKLSADPLFIENVRDIVGLYLNPPDRALVLCVDEKSQIQALDRTRPLLPLRPGQAERCTHDYVRHGTGACIRAAPNWRLPSTATWTSPTKTPSPSYGPRPLTKSWPAWLAFASVLWIQDTSSVTPEGAVPKVGERQACIAATGARMAGLHLYGGANPELPEGPWRTQGGTPQWYLHS